MVAHYYSLDPRDVAAWSVDDVTRWAVAAEELAWREAGSRAFLAALATHDPEALDKVLNPVKVDPRTSEQIIADMIASGV